MFPISLKATLNTLQTNAVSFVTSLSPLVLEALNPIFAHRGDE
jgi:hypothetical protein